MTPAMRAEHISFSYGKREVLRDVTLAVGAGEVVAIIGPNGAGKTTLLKVLAGLLAPCAGHMDHVGARASAVAYLAQAEELPADWLARDVIELGRLPHVGLFRHLSVKDEQAIDEALERTKTRALADRLVGSLSGGERQRVALARALAQEPRVLLLDEPTTHLDLRYQASFLSLLRAEADRGVGVAAVMHDLTSAGQADRCILFSEGQIVVSGSPREVLRVDVVREVFGTEVELLEGQGGRIIVVPKYSGEGLERKEPSKWARIGMS